MKKLPDWVKPILVAGGTSLATIMATIGMQMTLDRLEEERVIEFEEEE